jgi:hypothetical protein
MKIGSGNLPGRHAGGLLTLALIIGLLLVDQVQSVPIDPFMAPAPMALGSGQAPMGGHCTNF